jgi:hypothetical protein
MITIGCDQQIGQLVGKLMLTDEWVSQQSPKYSFPTAMNSGIQCQLLVRRDVGNEPGV